MALHLRHLILSIIETQKQLSEYLTLQQLKDGTSITSPKLLTFFCYFLSGTNKVTDHIEHQVRAVCDDVIFIMPRGRIKPSKNVSLGLAIKSLTGSRPLIDILNRFGYAVHYHTVESIETGLATTITERHTSMPDCILQLPLLCTALAWDNYDENCETLSGSGTLHDTVRICYQNIAEESITTNCMEHQSNQSHLAKKNVKYQKLSFNVTEKVLEPFRKKPKICKFQYKIRDVPRPLNLTLLEYIDYLWMIQMSLDLAPMWCGWNSVVNNDPLPK